MSNKVPRSLESQVRLAQLSRNTFRLVLVALAIVVIAAVEIGWPKKATAQVTYEGCYVGAGIPVPSIPTYAINDIAMATIEPSVGAVIYYNPAVIAIVSQPTRRFFYYHECAHHALGHTLGLSHPLVVEQQADCWAIISLVRSGQFGDAEIRAVQNDLARLSPGDWSHLPGPQRAINFHACLGG